MAKTFTAAEITEHNKRDNVWVVVHEKVYDVTRFLDEHPGGEEVILENAGIDATESFEDIGHSEDARDLLKEYYIGDLEGPPPTYISHQPSAGVEGQKQGSGPWGVLVPVAVGAALVAYKFYFA